MDVPADDVGANPLNLSLEGPLLLLFDDDADQESSPEPEARRSIALATGAAAATTTGERSGGLATCGAWSADDENGSELDAVALGDVDSSQSNACDGGGSPPKTFCKVGADATKDAGVGTKASLENIDEAAPAVDAGKVVVAVVASSSS